MSQKDIVYQIVEEYQPVRTEVVKREAMLCGISCGDRYLRAPFLNNEVEGKRLKGDKTKTWWIA